MIRIYTTFNSDGSRKAVRWLESNNINFTEKNLSKTKISTKELINILNHTNNGFDDIISKRSKIYCENAKKIKNLKFSDMVRFIQDNPKVLKRPIVVADDRLMIGYSEEEITIFRRIL